ncbi:hypothetical protein LKMONMHP_2245 [Methylobacterium organophilum]|uniref:DUF2325 domain-containing protein n=1 Tax=Methylobacterium organophilum TaxID=410 RepID=A0ABQ4T8M3_METOR|nr:hypothetical protein LKMONMHP_2245 [Methylobacterium organophilum]
MGTRVAYGSHLDGPALRALQAKGVRPAFAPVSASPEVVAPAEIGAPPERRRERIWELSETLHCSIVGTCLSTADARSLLAKLGVAEARSMREHRLHGEVVHLARRRDGGGRLLQKMLDRRHEREIRRFDRAESAEAVRALWRASLERGEIPGAYWAAITHPATDWPLVQDIFGEVHMLSHLVGQSNRADIRRLRQLEGDLAEREERIAAQETRIRALTGERDDLEARRRESLATRAVAQASPAKPDTAMRAALDALEARLARECAHAEALEEKLAVLMRASAQLSGALETELARRGALEAELAALEGLLGGEEATAQAPEPGEARLAGRRLLYVGGRPRQVARLRRFVEARDGTLLSHDGGLEDSMSLLPGLVSQSDLVLFPVECVSHEATGLVKRCCEAGGTPFRPVRSASLASFLHAVTAEPLPGRA